MASRREYEVVWSSKYADGFESPDDTTAYEVGCTLASIRRDVRARLQKDAKTVHLDMGDDECPVWLLAEIRRVVPTQPGTPYEFEYEPVGVLRERVV